MKKDSTLHTSQDYDRKHGRDHISHNPRAAKGLPSRQERGTDGASMDIPELITQDKLSIEPAFTEDKRETARHEHTNHFTNRASAEKK